DAIRTMGSAHDSLRLAPAPISLTAIAALNVLFLSDAEILHRATGLFSSAFQQLQAYNFEQVAVGPTSFFVTAAAFGHRSDPPFGQSTLPNLPPWVGR
ncbi:hypothetical protein T310_5148, partial [Rasamsonia emersonii CBS 393.64]